MRPRAGAGAVTLLVITAACGKKGPPLPPLRPVPAAVADLTARRVGADIYLQFTVPVQNQDGTRPADLAAVEIYGLTVLPQSGRLDLPAPAVVLRRGVRVAAVAVAPPATDTGKALSPPADTGGPRGQGERVTVIESAATLASPPDRGTEPSRKATAAHQPGVPPGPLWGPGRVSVPHRVYVAVGLRGPGRRGPPSPLVAVPLGPIPAAPLAVSACYSETAVTVEWLPAPTARRGALVAPAPPLLPARPIVPLPPPTRYHVYEAAPLAQPGTAPPRQDPPRPLTTAPLGGPPFVDSRIEFGTERCYVVRAVETIDGVEVESPSSPPACVTLIDVFPPPPPQGLAVVAGAGVMHLVWEPVGDARLAGYLVLRGDAPDEKLRALTPAPIRETTYRDATVEPGRRYIYVVVAVDQAGNVSAPSNRVEETAR